MGKLSRIKRLIRILVLFIVMILLVMIWRWCPWWHLCYRSNGWSSSCQFGLCSWNSRSTFRCDRFVTNLPRITRTVIDDYLNSPVDKLQLHQRRTSSCTSLDPNGGIIRPLQKGFDAKRDGGATSPLLKVPKFMNVL